MLLHHHLWRFLIAVLTHLHSWMQWGLPWHPALKQHLKRLTSRKQSGHLVLGWMCHHSLQRVFLHYLMQIISLFPLTTLFVLRRINETVIWLWWTYWMSSPYTGGQELPSKFCLQSKISILVTVTSEIWHQIHLHKVCSYFFLKSWVFQCCLIRTKFSFRV